MSQVYTGIDLGTNSIKIVVAEKHHDDYHVLASVSEKSNGIKNGQIEDTKLAVLCVKKAIKKANEMLGIKITKVIAAVPPTSCHMDIVVGAIQLNHEKITGEDVSHVLEDAIQGQIPEEQELITAVPISFRVDEKENIMDPKGMNGETLETKVVISTLAKEPLYRILEVLKLSGVEVVDLAFTSTGDYYAVKSKKLDSVVGAVINIGEHTTNVSVFNKGIQIKNALIPVGSNHVDRDISYIFKVDHTTARNLKEKFAVSLSSYADNNDVFDIITKNKEEKEISQVGVSKVVEARLKEILKLAKNEIKNLTKREIRYIIITGGLSELAGFQYLVEEEFGIQAKVCNIMTIGIRHNQYSSALGVVKYFDDKLSLRGKEYPMLLEEDYNRLLTTGQKINNNENIISKVFGHFFDN